MRTCATCKHLGKADPLSYFDLDTNEEHVSEHRVCNRIPHGNDYGDRAHDLIRLEAPAVVTDGSGYVAKLLVLPTFGCVLHEAVGS